MKKLFTILILSLPVICISQNYTFKDLMDPDKAEDILRSNKSLNEYSKKIKINKTK